MTDPTNMAKRKEIYNYEAPFNIYAMSWSNRPEPQHAFRLAIGSVVDQYNNKVQIVQQVDNNFQKVGEFDHPYPPTKIMWSPDRSSQSVDMVAATGDYLRLWSVSQDDRTGGPSSSTKLVALLNNNKTSEYCNPLTSFDWSDVDPNIIGTSSIDTTCTIWDLNTSQPKTQLIAHDKEVYDIAFAKDRDMFASAGADGSVRMFDLRSLEHSTIIYETQDLAPLLRLAWNKQDSNYLATMQAESSHTVILDIRLPSTPVLTLGGHTGAVNAFAWAPHSSGHICTGGEDSQTFIWELMSVPKPVEEPILAYKADGEINQLQWSASHPEWISVAFNNTMQVLRV